MRAWPASSVAISLLVLAGCTVPSPGVESTRSRQNDNGKLIPTNAPGDTTLDTTVDTTPIPVQQGIIDFGANKPERAYDGYLTAAFSDIEAFWKAQFPTVYGNDFTPLSGGIYAAYPERTEPIPGCGTPETTYADVEGNAFYCVDGDFMAYDDAELLPQLVDQLGQSAVAVVLAHEFGHAVQFRADEFEQPTILKEQQADCFAGAWAARRARRERRDQVLRRRRARRTDRHDPGPRPRPARRADRRQLAWHRLRSRRRLPGRLPRRSRTLQDLLHRGPREPS